MEARCQCHATHFPIPFDRPLMIAACHCNKCKLSTGSVYNVNAVFRWFDLPADAQAQLKTFTMGSDAGNPYDGHFCTTCGSRMLHTDGRGGKEWISVSVPRIVDFDWALFRDKELVVHCWTKMAVVDVPEGFKAFEGEIPRPSAP